MKDMNQDNERVDSDVEVRSTIPDSYAESEVYVEDGSQNAARSGPRVVTYAPSERWIPVNVDDDAEEEVMHLTDEGPSAARADDRSSIFSMTRYGSMDWDHSGDEFENIAVSPRSRRKSSTASRNDRPPLNTKTPAQSTPTAKRRRSSKESYSSSSQKTATTARDSKGRFTSVAKIQQPNDDPSTDQEPSKTKRRTSSASSKKKYLHSAENTSVHVSVEILFVAPKILKRRASTGDLDYKPPAITRDAFGRFTSRNLSGGPIQVPPPATPRKRAATMDSVMEPKRPASVVRDEKGRFTKLEKKPKAKKAVTKSPYFTPPISPSRKGKAKPTKDIKESVDAPIKPGLLKPSKLETPQKGESSSSQESPSKRSPGGIVSCIPFPPLSSPYFGLIQERLAHDPFRLLVAVTFLIRTHGKHAIPVFYELMEKYPTPESLVSANKEDIVPIIRHLGLQNQRASTYQTYAQIWLDDPPTKDKRYTVRGYPSKDSGRDIKKSEILTDSDPRDAWEIGHVTQGPYAIDSWRIFCRDLCRGKAMGWNGEGNVEGEGFQPEWMRVKPEDKELRAFLRWMWLKEGFEWDPESGEKDVASEELMRAAMEGRITWDERGGMRMLEGVGREVDGGVHGLGGVDMEVKVEPIV